MQIHGDAEEFFEQWGILHKALALGASDIHLSQGSAPMARIRGELSQLDPVVLSEQHMTHLLRYLTDNNLLSRYYDQDHPADVDFTAEFPTLERRFRINIFRQNFGSSIVMRVLAREAPAFEQLGIPESFRRVVDERSGLVLVSGSTGSGKSTTLAALIEMINNTHRKHIITIEDPIEVVFKNRLCLVEQRELGAHTQSFAEALKSALRQAPDVILVGEIRDPDTARMALRAAQVGVLVLATLHTRNAPESVNRLASFFEDNFRAGARTQIADTLRAVLCQKLLPRIDQTGQIACCELLWGTAAVRHLVRDDRMHLLHSLMEITAADGMLTMEQSLLQAFRSGTVDLQVAYDNANDKQAFLSQLEPKLQKELQIQWETDVEIKRLEQVRETQKRQASVRST